MPPQKKAKSVVTLHKFFATPGPSKPTTKSPKPPIKPNAKQHSITRDSREIIVIDSDSDQETAPKKRKRRDSSSSDVQVVASGPVKRASAPAPVLVSEPTVVSFGPPSELLGGSAVAPPLTFGKPSTLLAPLPNDEPQVPETNFIGEDDWGTGDDELVIPDDDDDDDESSLQLDDPPVDQVALCPLCQMDLKHLSEAECQTHVNACLDGPLAPKAGPAKSTLKPLSSLRVPTPRAASSSDAFSVLMTSGKEQQAWTEATLAERSRGTKTTRRPAPFYKIMPGMPIAVDAFRYGRIPGITAYFLTHAHSDHYTNLSHTWSHAPIYCSHGTARLITHLLGVDPKYVVALPMDVPTLVPGTGGVSVTLIEANHCPGSCLFLFEGPQTTHAGDSVYKSPHIGKDGGRVWRYLHCGDFRASPAHVRHPAVRGKRLDYVYLDTTYLDPRYTFPPQPLVISACADAAVRIAAGKNLAMDGGGGAKMMDAWVAAPSSGCDPTAKGKQKQNNARTERTLMVVGTYSVGKERIVKAIAQALHTKIYCDARKSALLLCQPDPELHALLTADPLAADVHILPLGMISVEKLGAYAQRFKGAFGRVVGWRPTGWTFSPPKGATQSPSIPALIASAQTKSFTWAHLRPSTPSRTGPSGITIQIIPVPYSEHSSFFELTCFALSVDWVRMIPTVGVGSERGRAKMGRWIGKWEEERRRRGRELGGGEVGEGVGVKARRGDYW